MIISIHALREEGDHIQPGLAGDFCVISIHALREEGDPNCIEHHAESGIFLSTPSARRATLCEVSDTRDLAGISIHALREEGDR